MPQRKLLLYLPVIQRGPKVKADTYTFTAGGVITLNSSSATYRFRFTEPNGYMMLLPYAAPPNDPWYVRIRFNLRPVAVEYSRMPFNPKMPYMIATWVPGTVVAKNVVDFERKNMWWDALVRQYPDILVYDKNYNLKFALDGVQPDLTRPADKGYLFPWRAGQVLDIDPVNGRCHVGVDLEPDDIIFGFYSYTERDFIYFDLDVNPYSNLDVKDRVVRFFHKPGDPHRVIFHEIINGDGSVHSTNLTAAATGSRTNIGQMTVGFSVGTDEIEITDMRVRGGGLHPDHQDIEQAQHMWDLGYWDGKPYPLTGAAVIMLPVSVLERFSREQVEETIKATLPMGSLSVIRYYSEDGQEFV